MKREEGRKRNRGREKVNKGMGGEGTKKNKVRAERGGRKGVDEKGK